MIAIAQDSQGATRVGAVVKEMTLEFPVLVDQQARLAGALGFQIVPAGAMIASDGSVVYASDEDFDIADPRLRANLDAFLAGELVAQPKDDRPMSSAALALFAEGADTYAQGEAKRALEIWRSALELDPDNFLIRSQIWAAEHPERFWPVVDREWQERQLIKEGYEKPLP